jgi:hypothetical protein
MPDCRVNSSVEWRLVIGHIFRSCRLAYRRIFRTWNDDWRIAAAMDLMEVLRQNPRQNPARESRFLLHRGSFPRLVRFFLASCPLKR